jgi:hypothetical protein
MRKDILDFLKRKSKSGTGELKKINKFMNELTTWQFDIHSRNTNNKISDDAMYNYINYCNIFISLLGSVFPNMIINKQMQTIDPHVYWGFSRSHIEDIKSIVTSYYEPLKKFYGVKTINNVLYEIQSKCRSIILLATQTPALTPIKIGDKVTYSVFDKRLSTLLFEYYILQIFTEYINLTKDPSMITKMLVEPEKEDTGFSSDFLIEQQLCNKKSSLKRLS